ncbi:MAG: hypothetical protein IKP24_02475 [Alphaproteobacteria bacterium]|nr:hypothetical protein [Alphaproteobacteria bacterium]
MSIVLSYDPRTEPYYGFFIKNGYSYIGHGYMHVVFEKNGIIYKVLRSAFGTDKDVNRFKFEADMLETVSRYGVPAASVVHIYAPDELIPNYCVLAEKKILGKIYSSEELNIKRVCEIQSVLNKVHNISLDFFGPISTPVLQVNTWREYMNYLIKKAHKINNILKIDINIQKVEQYFITQYNYNDKAKFLILDPNEKNYIFDSDDNLNGVIDIDHPIAFDPLYEFAGFLYSRPKTFSLMHRAKIIDTKDMPVIKNYAIIYTLYDLWFRYEKNKCVINKRLDYYIKKATMFLKNSKEIL